MKGDFRELAALIVLGAWEPLKILRSGRVGVKVGIRVGGGKTAGWGAVKG